MKEDEEDDEEGGGLVVPRRLREQRGANGGTGMPLPSSNHQLLLESDANEPELSNPSPELIVAAQATSPAVVAVMLASEQLREERVLRLDRATTSPRAVRREEAARAATVRELLQHIFEAEEIEDATAATWGGESGAAAWETTSQLMAKRSEEEERIFELRKLAMGGIPEVDDNSEQRQRGREGKDDDEGGAGEWRQMRWGGLRGAVWKRLLGVGNYEASAETYSELLEDYSNFKKQPAAALHNNALTSSSSSLSSSSLSKGRAVRGASSEDLKMIIADAQRTFIGEPLFWGINSGQSVATAAADAGQQIKKPTPATDVTATATGAQQQQQQQQQQQLGGACDPSTAPWPLVRVLSALSNWCASAKPQDCGGVDAAAATVAGKASGGKSSFLLERYVPGMNTLGGILLVAMANDEVNAFYCLRRLLAWHCPTYFVPSLEGVHTACELVDRCLAAVDPPLHEHLRRALGPAPTQTQTASISSGATLSPTPPRKGGGHLPKRQQRQRQPQPPSPSHSSNNAPLTPYHGAFALPMLMSLFACCRPLTEVMRLWDTLLAFGVHFNVPLCVAQLVLLRSVLLNSKQPLQHLSPRRLPPLDAELLVKAAFEVNRFLPTGLREEIMHHARYPRHRLRGFAEEAEAATAARSKGGEVEVEVEEERGNEDEEEEEEEGA